MTSLKITILSLFAVLTFNLSAQDSKLLSKVPETKEEFIASEPQVIASIDWIENTPMDQDEEMRKFQYSMLLQWMTNSPTVTLELSGYLSDYTKKNTDLLFIFMGGWTRYALQNEYTKDEVPCNLAGLQSMIKVYKAGKLKKDKKMDELVALEASGGLEAWLKEKLAAK